MNPMGILSLTLVICALLNHAVVAADPKPVPPGRTLFNSDEDGFYLAGADVANAAMERVAVSGHPFKAVYRVRVDTPSKDAWRIQMVKKLDQPLPRDHVMLLTGYVRVISTDDEADLSHVSFVLEQGGAPHDKEVNSPANASRQWVRFDYPFRVRHNHAETGSQIALRVAQARQTVEIGGVRLIDYGKDYPIESLPKTQVPAYKGQSLDAPWRAAAAERIEKHRKGDLAIEVVDAQGQPVSGAAVAVRMQRHAFSFGCVYNPRRIAGTAADEPDSEIYRQKFVELFNEAVDEWMMKWPAWENEQQRQWAIDSAKSIREQGIRLRGHTMIWPSWRRSPDRLQQLASDPAALREAAAAHIASVGSAFAGQVVDWDVVNEPYTHYDLLEILGRDVMVEWFKLARQADPDAVLYLNEAGQPNSPPSAERYDVLYNDLKMLIDGGAPIGGIGMQGHFQSNLNSPEELLAIYDRFAVFGLPIKITELDIEHPDPQVQADYMRDFLTVTFSHPAINGIVLWGFWEGQHWRPQRALWARDWTIRPVGQAWLDLVRKEWWTNADGTTDAQGRYTTRGFLGDYEITVTSGDRTKSAKVSLDRDGETLRVVLD